MENENLVTYKIVRVDDESGKKKKRKIEDKKALTIFMILSLAMSLVCCIVSIFVISAYINITDTSYKKINIMHGNNENVEVVEPNGTELTSRQIYALACEQSVSIASPITENGEAGISSGTGFFIKPNGYILSNYHIVEEAYKTEQNVSVTVYDGTCYTASIIGVDEANDIAILKIMAENYNAVTFGSINDVYVGDTVYAVGNPMTTLYFTMTSGIVSATDRILTVDDDKMPIRMFQFDAAVNSGNSGGPLYNSRGEVIGIVTAKYTILGVEGLGFAIPIDVAIEKANEIMENGEVDKRTYLGVSIDNMFNIVHDTYEGMPDGAKVYSVVEGHCCDIAGIKAGDIITKFNDAVIKNYDDIYMQMSQSRVGEVVKITIYRNGEYVEFEVTLEEAPDVLNIQESTTQN